MGFYTFLRKNKCNPPGMNKFIVLQMPRNINEIIKLFYSLPAHKREVFVPVLKCTFQAFQTGKNIIKSYILHLRN